MKMTKGLITKNRKLKLTANTINGSCHSNSQSVLCSCLISKRNNWLTQLISAAWQISWGANSFSASQEILHILQQQRIVTVFTRVHHISTSWAIWIQSTPSHSIHLWSNVTLFSHLHIGIPSDFLPSGFPTKTLYAFHVS